MNLRKTVKEIFYSYIIYALLLPTGYILRIIYAKNLSLEEFGMIYGTIGFFALMGILVDFGLNDSFKYFASKKLAANNLKKLKEIFWKMASTQSTIILFIGSLLLIFSQLITTYYFKFPQGEVFFNIFTIYFILHMLANFARNLFVIYGDQPKGYLFELIKQISIIAITYVFIIQNTVSLKIIGIAWVCSQIIFLILAYYQVLKKHKYLFRKIKLRFQKKNEMNFNVQILISNIGSIIFQTIDIFFITYFIGVAYVGIYATGLSIISIITLFSAPLLAFIIPLFAQVKKSDKKIINTYLEYIYKLGFFLIIPIATVSSFFATEYIHIIFGVTFLESIFYVQLFSIFIVFKIFYSFNSQIMTAYGDAKKRMQILLLAVAINIIGNIFSIIFFGMVGVAITTSVTWLIAFVLSAREVFINNKFTFKLEWLKKIIISMIFFLGLIFTLKIVIELPAIYEVFLVFGISYGAYVLIGWKLNLFNKQEILNMIPNFKK